MGGVDVHLHAFLTSALDGGELSASRQWIRGWVDAKAGLDVEAKRKYPTIVLPGY
jgi:hypothetical protein